MRTTMDIDANITGMSFEFETIKHMMANIVNIDIDDGVSFELDGQEPIKEDNEYGGYKFKVIAKCSNLIIPFFIDISTGDIITPRALEYKYKLILEDGFIDLYTYNYETIIAEKLETILKRNVANSRMKDFYDIYFFVNYKWEELNLEILKKSITTTFKHRNSEFELSSWREEIEKIANNENILKLWQMYVEKHQYAKNIGFSEVINSIVYLCENII